MLTQHSSVFQIISWVESTWLNAKCKQRKSLEKLFVQRFVYIFHQIRKQLMFSLKSINLLTKHEIVLLREIIICATLYVRFWSRSKARGGAKSKNRHLGWLYWTVVGLSEVVFWGVLLKKVALKNFTIFTGKHLCWGLFLIKLQAFSPATFSKRDSNTGVFCGYCESLRLPILKNICERLLFDCFNGSLLHRPKGSRSILYESVKV